MREPEVRRLDFEFNRNPLGLHLGGSGGNMIRFIVQEATEQVSLKLKGDTVISDVKCKSSKQR